MSPIKVFIAGPYTRRDPYTNVLKAIYAADWIVQTFPDEVIPFVPHLFHFWDKQCPKDYKVWTQMDMEWLKVCQMLWRLPGESIGADAETEEAKKLGIPVCFTQEEVKITVKELIEIEKRTIDVL